MDTVEKIKLSKKYKGLDKNIIEKEIKEIKQPLSEKALLKEVKKNLHRIYSSFQTRHKKKIKKLFPLLKKAILENNEEQLYSITNRLLNCTLSTKERKDYYEEIYKTIFSQTCTPHTLLDAACGLNVFSYPLMKLKKLNYIGIDLNEEDKKLVTDYARLLSPNGLKAKFIIADLREIKKQQLPLSDLTFLWKTLDLLDKKGHQNSKKLVLTLLERTRFLIVSFSTRTLTGKRMKMKRRLWFERFLNDNRLNFKTFSIKNEVFYIIPSKPHKPLKSNS